MKIALKKGRLQMNVKIDSIKKEITAGSNRHFSNLVFLGAIDGKAKKLGRGVMIQTSKRKLIWYDKHKKETTADCAYAIMSDDNDEKVMLAFLKNGERHSLVIASHEDAKIFAAWMYHMHKAAIDSETGTTKEENKSDSDTMSSLNELSEYQSNKLIFQIGSNHSDDNTRLYSLDHPYSCNISGIYICYSYNGNNYCLTKDNAEPGVNLVVADTKTYEAFMVRIEEDGICVKKRIEIDLLIFTTVSHPETLACVYDNYIERKKVPHAYGLCCINDQEVINFYLDVAAKYSNSKVGRKKDKV